MKNHIPLPTVMKSWMTSCFASGGKTALAFLFLDISKVRAWGMARWGGANNVLWACATSDTLLILRCEDFHVKSNTLLMLSSEHFHVTSERQKEVGRRRCQFVSLIKLLAKYLWIHRRHPKKHPKMESQNQVSEKNSWCCGEMMNIPPAGMFLLKSFFLGWTITNSAIQFLGCANVVGRCSLPGKSDFPGATKLVDVYWILLMTYLHLFAEPKSVMLGFAPLFPNFLTSSASELEVC